MSVDLGDDGLPIVAGGNTELLHRLYLDLPEHYRTADAGLDWPMYFWLAGLLLVGGEVETLFDRIDFIPEFEGGAVGDTSDLADPVAAAAEWLPWLAQLVGVQLNPGLPVSAQRDAIETAVSGFRAGTRPALAAAAKSLLTGTQFVQVYDHTIASPGDGGEWDVLLVTRDEETPFSGGELIDRVEAQGAKPAGVVLHHRSYTAPWDAVDAAYATWAATDGLTWNQMDDTGL